MSLKLDHLTGERQAAGHIDLLRQIIRGVRKNVTQLAVHKQLASFHTVCMSCMKQSYLHYPHVQVTSVKQQHLNAFVFISTLVAIGVDIWFSSRRFSASLKELQKEYVIMQIPTAIYTQDKIQEGLGQVGFVFEGMRSR